MLRSLLAHGLTDLVLCPGSRSAPLAMAAGLLEEADALVLHTAIDERSAGFLALGLATASGIPVAVITTSGSAVANLLPAAVEADRSCQPLILISADRPIRLKNCGSNQTVNQEEFLRPVCRWIGSGPLDGLDQLDAPALDHLAATAWTHCLCSPDAAPGPVHLNLPFDEPLHASREEMQQLSVGLQTKPTAQSPRHPAPTTDKPAPRLNPQRPGVVVAGPWRGLASALPAYQRAVRRWCRASGWPVLADPLAQLPEDCPGCLPHWELQLEAWSPQETLQVLRLGPLPASRRLERWLQRIPSKQVLVSEAEPRRLDPLGIAQQFSGGVVAWLEEQVLIPAPALDASSQDPLGSWLEHQLPLAGAVTEPALARGLAQLLPPDLPLMLAASSPVRDWLTWSGSCPGSRAGSRPCFSFRGASGLDGTLSLAMGLALKQGPLVLVCGDLALLHDSNGWLHAAGRRIPLLVLLIDNAGGGIFQQLTIPAEPQQRFSRLFAMPQAVDPLALAAAHGIPGRQISCLEDLDSALAWGLGQAGPALLRVCTDARADAALRQQLRAGAQNAALMD
ncbi:MAG: 2-succinyl-5-enolpyruvyl-6-hydroxy-3-cyclohexene-1-carboxylic-acid synthase [Synechococcus sp.]